MRQVVQAPVGAKLKPPLTVVPLTFKATVRLPGSGLGSEKGEGMICFGETLATVLALALFILIMFVPFDLANEEGGQKGENDLFSARVRLSRQC